MPRPASPQWSKSADCWYANVGSPDSNGRATEVYFRKPIGDPPVHPPKDRKDKGAAWDWLRAYDQQRALKQIDISSLTVGSIVQMYLKWAKDRVAIGNLTKTRLTNQTLHLSHFSTFQPDGKAPYRSWLASDMKPHHLQTAIDSWLKSPRNPDGYAPGYVASIVGSVIRMFGWASRPAPGRDRERLIAVNPFEKFNRPMVPHSPERFAERRVAGAFLRFYRNHADRGERFKAIVGKDGSVSLSRRKTVVGKFERITILLERFLMGTGCRPGEACALEWNDIKWNAGLTDAGHPYAKAVIPFDRWKTGKKTGKSRKIYLSPRLSRALRRMYLKADRHPVRVFTHGRGKGGKGAGEPWESGSRLSKVILRVRRAAIAASDSARLKRYNGELDKLTPAEKAIEKFVFDDEGPGRIANYLWRHTAASTMLMMGIDPTTVAELLGTSVDMLREHYGHLLDSHLAKAADKFAGARSRIFHAS